MLMEYRALLELLQDVQNPGRVNRVDDEIKHRAQDPQFVMLLKQAIRDQSLGSTIQLTATVVFGKIVKENLSELESGQVMECIMEVLMDEEVDYRIKVAVNDYLAALMELSSEGKSSPT
jgi:hypothetical protein